jgi:N6-L-threonylcarbamoyladenine synthase
LARLGKPIFEFPEPQIPDLNFSFSGLKTSILYFLQKKTKENPDFIKENLNDICASVQSRIISILMKKLKKAALQTGILEVVIAGGVSANSGLREAFLKSGYIRRFIRPSPPFSILNYPLFFPNFTTLFKLISKMKI